MRLRAGLRAFSRCAPGAQQISSNRATVGLRPGLPRGTAIFPRSVQDPTHKGHIVPLGAQLLDRGQMVTGRHRLSEVLRQSVLKHFGPPRDANPGGVPLKPADLDRFPHCNRVPLILRPPPMAIIFEHSPQRAFAAFKAQRHHRRKGVRAATPPTTPSRSGAPTHVSAGNNDLRALDLNGRPRSGASKGPRSVGRAATRLVCIWIRFGTRERVERAIPPTDRSEHPLHEPEMDLYVRVSSHRHLRPAPRSFFFRSRPLLAELRGSLRGGAEGFGKK